MFSIVTETYRRDENHHLVPGAKNLRLSCLIWSPLLHYCLRVHEKNRLWDILGFYKEKGTVVQDLQSLCPRVGRNRGDVKRTRIGVYLNYNFILPWDRGVKVVRTWLISKRISNSISPGDRLSLLPGWSVCWARILVWDFEDLETKLRFWLWQPNTLPSLVGRVWRVGMRVRGDGYSNSQIKLWNIWRRRESIFCMVVWDLSFPRDPLFYCHLCNKEHQNYIKTPPCTSGQLEED